jgi:hypothetical protein
LQINNEIINKRLEEYLKIWCVFFLSSMQKESGGQFCHGASSSKALAANLCGNWFLPCPPFHDKNGSVVSGQREQTKTMRWKSVPAKGM